MIYDETNGGCAEILDIPYARMAGAGFIGRNISGLECRPWDSWPRDLFLGMRSVESWRSSLTCYSVQ